MAGTVLDPFCGTGGVLLEAAVLGLRGVGFDRERGMVRGSRTSLRSSADALDLAIADAGQLTLRPGSVNGIATDTRYGAVVSLGVAVIGWMSARGLGAMI